MQYIEPVTPEPGTAELAGENVITDQLIEREWETVFLLDFGNAIAAVRQKEELFDTVRVFLRRLNVLKGYAIRMINEDGKTMSTYVHDLTVTSADDPLINEVGSARYPINDGIQDRILNSDVPVFLDVDDELGKGQKAGYLHFWKSVGFKKVAGTSLQTAGKKWGILWLAMEAINEPLVKSLCSLISIAISNIKTNEEIIVLKERLEQENQHLNEEIRCIYDGELVGAASKMKDVYQLISRVANSMSTVLILGETGTGKELIARAIHRTSPRNGRSMIKINCAAMPQNLIESELFGHEKGSFTGAIDRRIGKFELAHNSTLFLDEIAELPLELQVKLLRVIQEREFERIGGKNTIKVDVRIVAATNRNLEEEVAAGRFRMDLFYRLNVFPILLPPLRDRMEDVIPLAKFFISRISRQSGIRIQGMTDEVASSLQNYDWPGNVRELEHLIEREVLLANDSKLTTIHLPGSACGPSEEAEDLPKALTAMERHYIISTLKRSSGKIGGEGGAAQILAVPPTTLHSKMKKLSITRNDYI